MRLLEITGPQRNIGMTVAVQKPITWINRTTSPGKNLLLFDGHCPFCTRQAQNLLALVPEGSIEIKSFQEPGLLDQFPGITHEACMQAMHLIRADGRVFRGFEAAVQALAVRPVLGRVAALYYVPGLRQLCDAVYSLIAARRYRFWGKTANACPGGTCALHAPKR